MHKKNGKIDLTTIDSVYDDLTSAADDELDFENDLYDYVFSDDTLESDSLIQSLSSPRSRKTGFAGIFEYVDGHREEVPWAHLFEPSDDQLTLVFDEQTPARTVSLEQLSCIRLARVPGDFPRNRDASCHVEIIEMIEGTIYHEAVHAVQNRPDLLFGFSTKKDSRFKYTLIPVQNIKKRYQRRHLGHILLDKKLITDDELKKVLLEHSEMKKIKLGKIIAEQARILYPAVEAEIQKAYEQHQQGLRIGEILVNAGLVTPEQVQQALQYQKTFRNKKLGNFLIEKGILQEKDVYLALAEKFRIPFIDLRTVKGSKKIISLLPVQLIQKLKVLPLSVKDDTLVVATLLPDPSPICEVLLRYSPLRDVEFVLVQPSHLKNVIQALFTQKKHPPGSNS